MKKKTTGLSQFMLLPLVTFIITGCAKDTTFEGIIEKIRLQHVPDAREGVFQVEGERAGRKVVLLRGEVDNIHIRDLMADSLVMAGFMIESSCAVTSAAQLSSAVDRVDLDGNLLINNNVFDGIKIMNGKVTLPEKAGIGVVPPENYYQI